ELLALAEVTGARVGGGGPRPLTHRRDEFVERRDLLRAVRGLLSPGLLLDGGDGHPPCSQHEGGRRRPHADPAGPAGRPLPVATMAPRAVLLVQEPAGARGRG